MSRLCRHDKARLNPISRETYCRWIEDMGYPPLDVASDRKCYGHVSPNSDEWNSRDLFFTVFFTPDDDHDYFMNCEVVRLWGLEGPGLFGENVETALAELEALEAASMNDEKPYSESTKPYSESTSKPKGSCIKEGGEYSIEEAILLLHEDIKMLFEEVAAIKVALGGDTK